MYYSCVQVKRFADHGKRPKYWVLIKGATETQGNAVDAGSK
jgi:hypothetical protein